LRGVGEGVQTVGEGISGVAGDVQGGVDSATRWAVGGVDSLRDQFQQTRLGNTVVGRAVSNVVSDTAHLGGGVVRGGAGLVTGTVGGAGLITQGVGAGVRATSDPEFRERAGRQIGEVTEPGNGRQPPPPGLGCNPRAHSPGSSGCGGRGGGNPGCSRRCGPPPRSRRRSSGSRSRGGTAIRRPRLPGTPEPSAPTPAPAAARAAAALDPAVEAGIGRLPTAPANHGHLTSKHGPQTPEPVLHTAYPVGR